MVKGFSEFQRNEVLVFNFPYPERWDRITLIQNY